VTRILFVYNADGGLLNGALDLLHKTFSPGTYACGLCAITYDTLGMKPQWRRYVATLPHPVVFHHRDDFAAAYPNARVPLPAVLLDRDGDLAPLIPAERFRELRSLDDLEHALSAALTPA
jgi:hypothetical protein